MSPQEIPLQIDMFSGELIDTRSQTQKRHDAYRSQPQQIEMFSSREVLQFGVQANPKLPISPKTQLELMVEDQRTEEERERDLLHEAEKQTYPMFQGADGDTDADTDDSLPKPLRLFVGNADRQVTIDGEPLPMTECAARHSPDGWNWGYGGSGPAALAHALLACVAGEDVADACYQDFKRDIVADWAMGQPWALTEDAVWAWLDARRMDDTAYPHLT